MRYKPDGTVDSEQIFEYTYDDKGNCLTQLEYHNFNREKVLAVRYLAEREIEYYD